MVFSQTMYVISLHSLSEADDMIPPQRRCRVIVCVDPTSVRYNSLWSHSISYCSSSDAERTNWVHHEADVGRRDTLLQVIMLTSSTYLYLIVVQCDLLRYAYFGCHDDDYATWHKKYRGTVSDFSRMRLQDD
jgi:hypothetical protein